MQVDFPIVVQRLVARGRSEQWVGLPTELLGFFYALAALYTECDLGHPSWGCRDRVQETHS